MNPPFRGSGGGTDWVARAVEWLKPGGLLATIVPGIGKTCPKEALDIFALANGSTSAGGGIYDLGSHEFRPADRGTDGATISVRELIVAKPTARHDAPYNGNPNYWSWATKCIVENNDWTALERLRAASGAGRRPSLNDFSAALMDQRTLWIEHGAPWLSDKVDTNWSAAELLGNMDDIAIGAIPDWQRRSEPDRQTSLVNDFEPGTIHQGALDL
jgi:hypothetical protein